MGGQPSVHVMPRAYFRIGDIKGIKECPDGAVASTYNRQEHEIVTHATSFCFIKAICDIMQESTAKPLGKCSL